MLSDTHEGKVHDYKNLKDEEIASIIPKKVIAVLDGGFKGIHYILLRKQLRHSISLLSIILLFHGSVR